MSGGRTSWWPKDHAWLRRELIIELGLEHGPGGPLVMDALSGWAQEQRGGGAVRGGFRSLARETFVTVEDARSIVSTAAEIGALDDLEIDPDGRRFSCRVSGWRADQERGRAAFRKAAQRERDAESEPGDRDESRSARSVTLGTPPNQTKPELPPDSPQGGEQDDGADEATVVRFDRKPVPDRTRVLAEQILAEFNRQAGTGYGAYTGRGKPSEDLKRILGALADADPPLEFDEAAAVIRWRLRDPFWDGRPGTGVVFGPKVFAANRESAKGGTVTRLSSRDIGRALRGDPGGAA